MTAFEQSESLTTRLRNILRDYPEGVGVFHELLQNADDSGASEVALLLDEGVFEGASLGGAGPALCVFNDGVFSEGDFASITSIGASGKARDAGTIGRFGVGFNTVFHLAERVSFISSDSLCVFDPHARSLPDGLVGVRCRFGDAAFQAQHSRELEPFEAALAGIPGAPQLTAPYPATLFRLPLRTEAEAACSEMSARAHSTASVLSVLHQLASSADTLLLFLQSVHRLRILHRAAAGSAVTLIRDVRIHGCTAELLASRKLLQRYVATAASEADAGCRAPLETSTATYELEIESCGGSDEIPHVATWLVSSAAGAAPGDLAAGAEATPVWWAAVAAPVHAGPAPLPGRLFCFLPLPTRTGLPVHLHAALALTTSRDPVVAHSGAGAVSARAAAQSKWNEALLSTLAAACYAKLLAALAARGMLGHTKLNPAEEATRCAALWAAWPAPPFDQPAPFDAVARDALRDAATQRLPVLRDATVRLPLLLTDVILVDSPSGHGSVGGSLHLTSLLRRCKASVCAAPPLVAAALHWAEVRVSRVSATGLVALLRGHPAVVPTREEACAALRCILSGEEAGDKDEDAEVPASRCEFADEQHDATHRQLARQWKLAVGLPLVPVLGGGVAALGKPGATPLLLAPAAWVALLPTGIFMDTAAPGIEAFDSTVCREQTCCRKLTMRALGTLLGACGALPAAWRGVPAIWHKADDGGNPRLTPGTAGAGSSSDGWAAVDIEQLREALVRVRLLWELVEAMPQAEFAADDCGPLESWPLIEIAPADGAASHVAPNEALAAQPALVSLRHALDVAVLSAADFPDADDRRLLASFGVLFHAGTAGPRQRAMLQCSVTRAFTAITANVAKSARGRLPTSHGMRLRALLRKSLARDGSERAATLPARLAACALPIFESLDPAWMLPLSSRPEEPLGVSVPGGEKRGGRKCGGGKRPAAAPLLSDVATPVAPDEQWDRMLRNAGEGGAFLDVRGDAALAWFEELAVSAPPGLALKAFLGAHVAPILDKSNWAQGFRIPSAELCRAFLEAVGSYRGEASFWRSSPSKQELLVTRLVAEARLVQWEAQRTSSRAEPSPSQDHTGWRRAAARDLADPEDKLLSRLLPDSSALLPPPAYRTPNIVWALRKGGMKSLAAFDVCLAAAREVATRADAALGALLLRALLDKDDLRFSSREWAQLREHAFVPALDATALGEPPDEWVADEARGVRVTFVAPGEASLWRERAKSWRVQPLLPPDAGKTPTSKYSRLGVQPVTLRMVLFNLTSWAQHCAAESSTDPPTLEPGAHSVAVDIARAAVGLLTSTTKKDQRTAKPQLEEACRMLQHVHWVPLDDGALCLARYVSFTVLEDDALNMPRDRKAPEWLEPHRACFEALVNAGGSSNVVAKPPAVRVRGSPPTDDALLKFVCLQLFVPALADVKLHAGDTAEADSAEYGTTLQPPFARAPACDNGCEESSTVLHAHRLVLSLRSPYFERLFAGPFAESASGCLSVALPVSLPTARRALAYMYIGDAEAPEAGGKLCVGSAEGIAAVCELLLLADVWCLDHLKSLCECLLASCIEEVSDVVALLLHADACNAPMLRRLCVHHVRLHVAACQKTDAWDALRPELRSLVLGEPEDLDLVAP
ncbi:hypothetical protein CYMTET_51784 [Cymbomonas tetramitiformis]|uniref:BTB domain-containing protein n=1 Tax=Cymbomonas tetramitiformis TaxID=36881 RepID=A0AAE0BKK4_9CHLO|nr:hypothetical protein CYMTET_51784 [Cymbomonas tetramitiformis]